MKLNDAERLIKGLMSSHGLHGWRFRWCGGMGGFCNFGNRTINISRKVAQNYDVDVVKKTALHEIAHALAGADAGHGTRWRNKARQIGGYDTPSANVPARRQAPAASLGGWW